MEKIREKRSYAKGEPIKRFRLIKDLLPIGEEFEKSNLNNIHWYDPVYECIVGIGKDYATSIVLPNDMVENNPDYFEEIK